MRFDTDHYEKALAICREANCTIVTSHGAPPRYGDSWRATPRASMSWQPRLEIVVSPTRITIDVFNGQPMVATHAELYAGDLAAVAKIARRIETECGVAETAAA